MEKRKVPVTSVVQTKGASNAEEIEKTVRACEAGYDLGFKRAIFWGGSKEKAHQEASELFKFGLPILTSTTVRAYVACVSSGIARGVFAGREARALLYAAYGMPGKRRS